MSTPTMRIRNWTKFQVFKDRRPPWIRLYRETLDQRDIIALSDRSYRVLVGLWLLASEDEDRLGRIPCVEDIAFRLRMDLPSVSASLVELQPFLIQDDINVISGGYQVVPPETETETDQRREEEISCPTTPDGDGQQSDSLKSKKQEVRDPLENLPMLSKAYDAIQGRIKQVHPRAKTPEPGTKADIGARSTLECLVRLDKHSEQEILDTLRWVLYTEPEGDFTWRAQFHSIANLRHVKGGMSKFAKMLEAMKRFNKQAARAKIDPDEPLHHREAREKGILV